MFLITAIGELLACYKSPSAMGWKTPLPFQQETDSRQRTPAVSTSVDQPPLLSLHRSSKPNPISSQLGKYSTHCWKLVGLTAALALRAATLRHVFSFYQTIEQVTIDW